MGTRTWEPERGNPNVGTSRRAAQRLAPERENPNVGTSRRAAQRLARPNEGTRRPGDRSWGLGTRERDELEDTAARSWERGNEATPAGGTRERDELAEPYQAGVSRVAGRPSRPSWGIL